MPTVVFANPYFGTLDLTDNVKLHEYFPQPVFKGEDDSKGAIKRALAEPIDSGRLAVRVKSTDKVLIIVDDHSRITPVSTILPLIIAELGMAGVADAHITILIALGTHRPMSSAEISKRVGPKIYRRFSVCNHNWYDKNSLQYLGKTGADTDIWVNKLAVDADFIIGLGNIVPHRVAGYSGGGKIIQPGISGPITTGQTHWLSTNYTAAEILGNPNNPVRREMEEVAAKVGLKFIVNVVLDSAGKIAGVFAGDPIKAHRAGCKLAETIYGVQITEQADIVIAEAYPTESELWQATKALQAASIVVKRRGVVILAAACSEGISPSHEHLILKYGFRPLTKVIGLVYDGKITDLNVASYLARVGNVLQQTPTILVSQGITTEQAEKIGFRVANDLTSAVRQALTWVGPNPTVAILHQGSELLPIFSKNGGD